MGVWLRFFRFSGRRVEGRCQEFPCRGVDRGPSRFFEPVEVVEAPLGHVAEGGEVHTDHGVAFGGGGIDRDFVDDVAVGFAGAGVVALRDCEGAATEESLREVVEAAFNLDVAGEAVMERLSVGVGAAGLLRAALALGGAVDEARLARLLVAGRPLPPVRSVDRLAARRHR